jgi:hypothetical protein
MEYEKTPSGMVIPRQPEPPERFRGICPIEGEDRREQVANALDDLWYRAGLADPYSTKPHILAAQREVWRMLGRMWLGDDAQECGEEVC